MGGRAVKFTSKLFTIADIRSRLHFFIILYEPFNAPTSAVVPTPVLIHLIRSLRPTVLCATAKPPGDLESPSPPAAHRINVAQLCRRFCCPAKYQIY
jgi:hypothetical protein